MGLDLPVPDFSTLSRRADGLQLSDGRQPPKSKPVHLVVDSTGVKIFGAGEWQETGPVANTIRMPDVWVKQEVFQ